MHSEPFRITVLILVSILAFSIIFLIEQNIFYVLLPSSKMLSYLIEVSEKAKVVGDMEVTDVRL